MRYSNREIGKTIHEYRKKRHLTGKELGLAVGLSQSKLSKIETGFYAKLNYDEVTFILNILKVPRYIQQQIQRSLDTEHQQATLSRYPYFLNDAIDNEAAAKVVRLYSSSTLSALVQTIVFRKAYVTLNGASDDLQSDLKRIAARQDMLWDGDRKYELLLPQTVLYAVFTSKPIHLAQLDRLERLTNTPTFRIGIIPLEAGTIPADYGSFVVYDERMAIDCIVTGEVQTTNKQDVDAHLEIFERLQSIACYDDDAIALIRRAASVFV